MIKIVCEVLALATFLLALAIWAEVASHGL